MDGQKSNLPPSPVLETATNNNSLFKTKRSLIVAFLILLLVAAIISVILLLGITKNQSTVSQVKPPAENRTIELKNGYQNPFDKKTQYRNPFDNLK